MQLLLRERCTQGIGTKISQRFAALGGIALPERTLSALYRPDLEKWTNWTQRKNDMKPFEKCPDCGGIPHEKEVEKILKGGTNTAILHVVAAGQGSDPNKRWRRL